MKIQEALHNLALAFEKAGIEDARTDARALVAFAMKVSPMYVRMHPDCEIDPQGLEQLEAFKARRLKREPVSKITGTRGFWRLDFKVTADVLDPRPDSETLIEEVLRLKSDKLKAMKFLDLGTGSGCLALSLLSEYVNSTAIGFDQSQAALDVAAENARLNGLAERFKTVQGDWSNKGWESAFSDSFDVIIANPPYICENEILEPEVSLYDPAKALFAGKDGLDAYRILAPVLGKLLATDGIVIFEFGQNQHEAVRAIMVKCGFEFRGFGVDLGNIVRSAAFIAVKS